MLYKLILKLSQNHIFQPLSKNDYITIPCIQKPDNDEEEDLQYYSSCVFEYKSLKKQKLKDKTIFFADFETELQSAKVNIAFMYCISLGDCKINGIFKGILCGKQLLDYMSEYTNPVIIFHTLKYNSIFLVKYGVDS